jgi:hypothetical protein
MIQNTADDWKNGSTRFIYSMSLEAIPSVRIRIGYLTLTKCLENGDDLYFSNFVVDIIIKDEPFQCLTL